MWSQVGLMTISGRPNASRATDASSTLLIVSLITALAIESADSSGTVAFALPISGFSDAMNRLPVIFNSEQARGFDEKNQQKKSVHDCLGPRGGHELGADGFDEPDDHATDDRPVNASQTAQDNDDEALNVEENAHGGKDVVKGDQGDAGDPGHGGADAKRQVVNLELVDAGEACRIAIQAGRPDGATHTGALEKVVDPDSRDNGGHASPQFGHGDENLPNLDHFPFQGIFRNRPILGTEQEQGQIIEDVPDAGGDDDHRQRFADILFGLENGLDHNILQAVAEEKHQREDENQRKVGVQPGQRYRPEGNVHPDHQEGTVGKVDHLEHPENDGQAEGGQSIYGPHHDSVNCIFNEIDHLSLQPA